MTTNQTPQPGASAGGSLSGIERRSIVAGVALAAVGTILTGWATLQNSDAVESQQKATRLQEEATRLQADESRKNRENEEKEQASHVNFWPATTLGRGNERIVIANRSTEPVYRLRIYLLFSESPDPEVKKGDFATLSFGTLQPCQQIEVTLRSVGVAFPEIQANFKQRADKKLDYGILFTDASGLTFHRHAAGEKNPNPWLEVLSDGRRAPEVPKIAQFKDVKKFLADPAVFFVPKEGENGVVAVGAATKCENT